MFCASTSGRYTGVASVVDARISATPFRGAKPVYLPDVLAQNTVPVAAAVYYDDMFVPREFSLDTGNLIGACHYITNEYQHDGSAYSGGKVVSHLLDLLAD